MGVFNEPSQIQVLLWIDVVLAVVGIGLLLYGYGRWLSGLGRKDLAKKAGWCLVGLAVLLFLNVFLVYWLFGPKASHVTAAANCFRRDTGCDLTLVHNFKVLAVLVNVGMSLLVIAAGYAAANLSDVKDVISRLDTIEKDFANRLVGLNDEWLAEGRRLIPYNHRPENKGRVSRYFFHTEPWIPMTIGSSIGIS
jgi:hypothetical protein